MALVGQMERELFRRKVSNPLLLAVAAVIGLVGFPLLQPDWVFVK